MTTDTNDDDKKIIHVGQMDLASSTQREARRISKRLKRSEPWETLRFDTVEMIPGHGEDAEPQRVEFWSNAIYSVTVRRHGGGFMGLPDVPFTQLGISCHNGEPRHDWREFQHIKNDVCGPEMEAVELYPSESRLLDPSNYYMLWVAERIPVGLYAGRTIHTPENCIAPQRGWKGEAPKP